MDWKLEVVVVPVSDVERAKRFYSEQLGSVVDADVTVADMRVIQLTPPGSACSIAIGPLVVDAVPAGSARLQLCVHDIETAGAELVARNVEVGEVMHFAEGSPQHGPGEDYNSFVFFSDPDGNGWAVQQSPLVTA